MTFESEEAFKLLKKQYEEEKLNKRKAAARKIAPGFLDTDTRILKPEQTYVEFPVPAATEAEENNGSNNSIHTSPRMLQPAAAISIAFGAQDGTSNKVLEASPDKVSRKVSI